MENRKFLPAETGKDVRAGGFQRASASAESKSGNYKLGERNSKTTG
jgi:hypothetical protein